MRWWCVAPRYLLICDGLRAQAPRDFTQCTATQVGKAYKNSTTEWSIRYTVSPVGENKPLDQEFFVRFYYEREKTRKGYKYSVTKMSEDAASEA